MTQTRNLIDEQGIRTDGRRADELREIKITVGVVKNARWFSIYRVWKK